MWACTMRPTYSKCSPLMDFHTKEIHSHGLRLVTHTHTDMWACFAVLCVLYPTPNKNPPAFMEGLLWLRRISAYTHDDNIKNFGTLSPNTLMRFKP